MKNQVIVIHGGDVHNSYDEYLDSLRNDKVEKADFLSDNEGGWRADLDTELGDNFEVFLPEMPNANSAKYLEWKIWLDRLIGYVSPRSVFVGHSLGAIFLARYFAENINNLDPRGVFLIAPPYRDTNSEDKLADFMLPPDTSKLVSLGDRAHIYFSEDDPVVSFSNLETYRNIMPKAVFRIFKDRGHFRIKKFPELVEDIRNLFD